MPATIRKSLRRLRSTRDLKAEILALAAALVGNKSLGRLTVVDPVVNETTVRDEWGRLVLAISKEIRDRMSLHFESAAEVVGQSSVSGSGSALVELDRPNYRFEVLRLLIGAGLKNDRAQPEAAKGARIEGSQLGLIKAIGVSQTPVRSALAALKDAGIIKDLRGLDLTPERISLEMMGRIGALPQVLRFRFERGAQIKPASTLLKRVLPLLSPGAPADWEALSLSGSPVALADVASLDLMGMPRLDLLAHVPRDAKTFDARILRLLDDGLELEPNVLAPAPVVISVVRAETGYAREAGLDHARCAHPMDVFLSLLDLGLREQAQHYARALRQ
ncbi:MAG TPA: hypothetical protein VFN25_15095 [Dokdonella sp.]|uniref:hypothetical protein n=1 Tax=Dokdonella sp. TaxID=2291710 RepID=UPI002D7F673D|nr:hypothetical protein [Dokdonella sp.]HET9034217.1 hypothetical protein [Dokdonella sp.]